MTLQQAWDALQDFLIRTWWFWSLPPVWGALALVVTVAIIRGRGGRR